MAKEPLTEQEQIELELKKIDLEERKQALESRKLQDELARMQLSEKKAEVEMKRNNKQRGKADAEKAIADLREMQSRCNHHVGGEGAAAIIFGQGDMERPTAISGIQFTDQDIVLRCNRCGLKARKSLPNGDDFHAPWNPMAELFRRSQFKQIAVVGGLVVKKQEAIA